MYVTNSDNSCCVITPAMGVKRTRKSSQLLLQVGCYWHVFKPITVVSGVSRPISSWEAALQCDSPVGLTKHFAFCLSHCSVKVSVTMSDVIGNNSQGRVAMDTTSVDSAACTKNLTETDSAFSISSLDPAEEYKMNNKRRGRAIIFNQEHFYWQLGMPIRYGTNTDRCNLERRLKALNFEVEVYENYKQMEIWDRLREAAQSNHADADCFMLIFLSHGEQDHIYAYDGKISIQDITALFKGDKCQSLVGKPKIFILQACRGDKHDNPVKPCDDVDSEMKNNEVVVDASAMHTLPAGADFIMCYSVAEGYFSHRETMNGSWYIQDLCELLHKYGDTLEFTELLTVVNRKVSIRSVGNSNDRNSIGKKQVPCFASMLTKKLYFRPKAEGK